MIKVLDKTKFNGQVPVKLWVNWPEKKSLPVQILNFLLRKKDNKTYVEESARKQIINLCSLPFAFHHVAIMPDCHTGYGMPIGGVLATKGVVIPNAVGVDIGCGMCAVKTSLKAEQLGKETLKKIFGGSKEYHGGIRSAIPVGMNHHSKKQDESLMPPIEKWEDYGSVITSKKEPDYDVYPVISRQYESALKQIGTLGGGNHFIEIQKDTEGFVWIMIHSGSRNLGKQVADYYNKLAVELNQKWHSAVPKEWQLAFLPLDSKEGEDYLREMQYCVDFAFANRKLMMDRILDIMGGTLSGSLHGVMTSEPMINIAHNYARMENHFGKNVMIHRKGATSAKKGEIGIIPGCQGGKSYIVEGLGNPESFMSCSHGAGRLLSRTKASETLDLEAQKKILDDQGIIHGIRTQNDLEEAPDAYKNIDEVMNNQKDLVRILVELRTLGVIKG